MATLQQRAEDAVTQIEADKNVLHQIVHGGDQDQVQTENGAVDTVAKAIREAAQAVNSKDLAALNDVTMSNPQDGQILVREAGVWVNKPGYSGGSGIDIAQDGSISTDNTVMLKAGNLAGLTDTAAARGNLEAVGTKESTPLETGYPVVSTKGGDIGATFTVDHRIRGLQAWKVVQNFALNSDPDREGVTEILLKNDATGGHEIDSSALDGGFYGDYNNAAGVRHHLTLYSMKDQDDALVRWGYIKELGT